MFGLKREDDWDDDETDTGNDEEDSEENLDGDDL